VLSVPLIPIFIFYELKVAKMPIINMHLFQTRNISLACLFNFISGTAYLTPILLFPLHLSAIKSFPQRTSNALTLVLILSLGLAPMLTAHILSKTHFARFRITALTGSMIYTLGAALTLTTSPSTPVSAILTYSLLLGTGAGTITVPSALLGPLSGTPPNVASIVTTLASSNALGAAGSTVLLTDLLASEFVRALRREGLDDAATAGAGMNVVGGARLPGIEQITTQGGVDRDAIVNAVVSAYQAANVPGVIMGVVFAAALLGLQGLDVPRLPSSKPVVDSEDGNEG
jgi:hypothetical protein